MLPDRSRLKKINVSERKETGTWERREEVVGESRTSGRTRDEIEETGRNVAKNSTGGDLAGETRAPRGLARRLASFISGVARAS